MFPDLSTVNTIAFDTETSGLDPHKDYPVGYVLTWGFAPDESRYFPIRHKGGGNLEPGPVIRFAKDLLARTDLRVVMHKAAFDLWMAEKDRIVINGKIEDTGLNDPLIDENNKKYSLAVCCERAYAFNKNLHGIYTRRMKYLRLLLADNIETPDPESGKTPSEELEHLTGLRNKLRRVQAKKAEPMYQHLADQFGGKVSKEQMENFHRLSGKDPMAVEYAEGDGTSTLQLWEWQQERLDEEDLRRVWKVECDLIPVLHRARMRGVPVDMHELDRVEEQISEMRKTASAEIGDINPMAPTEVGPYIESIATCGQSDLVPPVSKNLSKAERIERVRELWDTDLVPLPPMTKPSKTYPEGQVSYNSDYLASFEGGQAVTRVRKLAHLENSFIAPLRERHIHNGMIYPNFHQLASDDYGTVTGRLSSSGPNMQQVPKRNKELGRIFRRIFVPPPGMILEEKDYSQCEYRIFAHFSRSQVLIDRINKPGSDVHKIVGDMIGVERDHGKELNFSLVYGLGVDSLAHKLKCSPEEAIALKAKYFQEFPEAEKLSKSAKNRVLQRGYVKTVLGRRRRFQNWRADGYKAMNAICQGGNADVIKIKMIEVDDYLQSEDRGAFAFSVHDALVNYLDPARHQETTDEISNICKTFTKEQHGFEFSTNMELDSGFGRNWSVASYGEEPHREAA